MPGRRGGARRYVSLPVHPRLTDEAVEYLIGNVRDVAGAGSRYGDDGRRFRARIERDARARAGGGARVGRGGGDAARARRSLEARIVPGFGCNLARFSVGGSAVIDFDPAPLLAHDFTGTPVLYPTPNRVRDCRFAWKGRVYPQRRAGRDVYEHGLAHLESWEFEPPTAGAEEARFAAWLDCRPGSPMFEAFPFPHRISLSFILTARGIRVEYAIENRGAEELPYGFGLHPYFTKLDGDGRDLRVAARGRGDGSHARPAAHGSACSTWRGHRSTCAAPSRWGRSISTTCSRGIEPGRHARVEYREELPRDRPRSHGGLHAPRALHAARASGSSASKTRPARRMRTISSRADSGTLRA